MFFDLLEHAELLAIEAALSPTVESIYRIKCRMYSTQFHTPLHMVYELDPMLVLQALYEDKYHPSIVEEELEELLEKLRKIEDPTYTKMSDQEVEDLVDQVINHENKRKSRKETKAPTQKTLLVKNTSEIVDLPSPPKSGGMSFTDLEKADEANESGKGGFED